MNANRLSGSGGLSLVHGAFDAVGHEVDSRVGARPSGGDVMGKYECWSPRMISAPASGDFEGTSAGEHCTKFGCETANVLGARLGHLERHGVRSSSVDFDVPRGEVPVEHLGHAIVEIGNVAVERHGHDCDNLRIFNNHFSHGNSPLQKFRTYVLFGQGGNKLNSKLAEAAQWCALPAVRENQAWKRE